MKLRACARRLRSTAFFILAVLCLCSASLAVEARPGGATEGPYTIAQVTAGPFDIHRKYRSMEGPYASVSASIGDIIKSGSVELPETMVRFVEDDLSKTPAMAGDNQRVPGQPLGLSGGSNSPRTLYWLKGVKLEVLDEEGKVMPTAEFICHFNIDVSPEIRNQAFPKGERCLNPRISSLSQGLTEMFFPDGFAVPVASDEVWRISFQAANRTTDRHRRLKHRSTLYFIKDSQLVRPLTALNWYVPFVTVVVDGKAGDAVAPSPGHGPSCLGPTAGVDAPNNVIGGTFINASGQRVSGHWVVPPGKHMYRERISDERASGFAARDRKIHFAWTHVHPLCTEASVVSCTEGGPGTVFRARVRTKTAGGLEIKHIDTISSASGIDLPKGAAYELQGKYDNTTGQPLDSMISTGIFCADDSFMRPDWALSSRNTISCAVRGGSDCPVEPSSGSAAQPAPESAKGQPPAFLDHLQFPLFDPAKDGPILTEKKRIALITSGGRLTVVLDPAMAPQHATQIYRLFKSGAYTEVPFSSYLERFVLQVSSIESSTVPSPATVQPFRQLVRRLPLEVSSQAGGSVKHEKWALSMSRFAAPDSATSSFSILMGDAPHLNGQYTVFGHLLPDAETLSTLERITSEWKDRRATILGVEEI